MRYNGCLFVCLFVIASDPSYIDKIHLQALPGRGGSLFCFPLHFHSGRGCTQPEKGLNQSLLKDERNLLTKYRFPGYVSATRGGTPSNSFEDFKQPF